MGAGASCELGFPSGSTLLENISGSLDFINDGFKLVRGDKKLYNVLHKIADDKTPVGFYLGSASKIKEAAHLGLSIDNVIHQLDHDPLVPVCAKLAIARQILIAENNSPLQIDRRRRDTIALAPLRATWLGRFVQILVQDKRRSELDDIFANVTLISFNYDRTIRRFMPFALSSQFGISDDEAQALTRKLRIYHPYGSLGPLPWEGCDNGVDFGGHDNDELQSVAKNLRTFTEQVDDGDELSEMRIVLSTAKRVVFLGFGYHRQNVELLTKDVLPDAVSVFGTSMGLSPSDEEVVKGQLNFFLRPHYRAHKDAILRSLSCVQFLDEHFRSLVS